MYDKKCLFSIKSALISEGSCDTGAMVGKKIVSSNHRENQQQHNLITETENIYFK